MFFVLNIFEEKHRKCWKTSINVYNKVNIGSIRIGNCVTIFVWNINNCFVQKYRRGKIKPRKPKKVGILPEEEDEDGEECLRDEELSDELEAE